MSDFGVKRTSQFKDARLWTKRRGSATLDAPNWEVIMTRTAAIVLSAFALALMAVQTPAVELDPKVLVYKLPDQINWGPVTPAGNQQAVLFGDYEAGPVRRHGEMAGRQSLQPAAFPSQRSIYHRAVGNMVGRQRT